MIRSLIALAGLLFSPLLSAELAVFLKDADSREAADCGELIQASMGPDGTLVVQARGACRTTNTGGPSLEYHSVSAEAGQEIEIHLLEGAQARLPIQSAAVTQPPQGLGTATLDTANPYDPILAYSAPDPLPAAPQALLTYTITEAGGEIATAQVAITLGSDPADSAAPAPPCTKHPGLECYTLQLGDRRSMQTHGGVTHAWAFRYDGQPHQAALFEGGAKDFAISDTAGAIPSTDSTCARNDSPSAVLALQPAATADGASCPLVQGRIYYINIRAGQGGYSLVTY